MKISEQTKGMIYDIQRYSLHDGPGIRTIVFLKGCPLRCLWCSNPESLRIEPEYMGHGVHGDEKTLVGKEMSVSEVMKVLIRDRVFYEGSGGGVTLSGGEVLAQPEFASEIIKEARQEKIHTVVETSGYSEFEIVWKVLEHVDLILYDIKGMDAESHRRDTGVSNDLILRNLQELSRKGKEIIVRVPLIPKHNANVENLQSIFDFSTQNGIKKIELLPYHRFGESKYERLSKNYALEGLKTQARETIEQLLSEVSKPEDIELMIV